MRPRGDDAMASSTRRKEATVDHPANLLPPGLARTRTVLARLVVIALRCWTAAVRGAAAAARSLWTDVLPWLFPLLARQVARARRHRAATALLRLAVAVAWRLAVVVVLAVAILLVTAAPAYAAQLAEADLWTLAGHIGGRAGEAPSGTVALVVASIVVLASVSSHSGHHHHHDDW
jgi:hypothetical protein